MRRFDQSSAKCLIFTYKEGFLSSFAHDLRINVGEFSVELDDDSMIRAVFDAASVHVDCAMVEGQEKPGLLSEADRKEIDNIILKEVLDTETYRNITFASASVTKEDSTYRVRGILSLRGSGREIAFSVQQEGDFRIADARLHLPDFGIRPYSALFGAVRIKPDILIRVALPL